MVLLNGQFLKQSFVFRTNHVSILAVDYIVILTVHKKRRHRTLPHIFQFYCKRVVLELSAIFLGHLQRKRYDKLRRFDVFAGNLKSDHLKRIKRRVNDLQQHVLRLIFDAVEKGGGGAHGPAPKYEFFKRHQPQVADYAISSYQ